MEANHLQGHINAGCGSEYVGVPPWGFRVFSENTVFLVAADCKVGIVEREKSRFSLKSIVLETVVVP